VLVFGAVWLAILLPRALVGHPALICLSLFALVAWVSFAVAAFTFSRDVLGGRWPS
jgi:hypothetical protein